MGMSTGDVMIAFLRFSIASSCLGCPGEFRVFCVRLTSG